MKTSGQTINWSGFIQELDSHVLAAQVSRDALALIVVNIRHLPIYNFRMGFQIGEQIVSQLLERLPTTLPRATTIDRIAPDKIAIIVPNVPTPELLSISAQKIVDTLAEPFLVGNEIVSVLTTAGVSIYPQHGETAEALISEAELSLRSSMEDAKAFHIPTATQSDQHLMMMQMGSDLQTAIADESLAMYYQAKFDLQTMKPVAAETLMRWTLPDGRNISPQEFIPVAEASGTINRLTQWAIGTALREGSELNGGGANYSVAVNLSAGTIYDTSLVHIVRSALAIWDLPPHLLTLEVTESSLMKDPEICFRNLSLIRDSGVRISIDDFGTGFSSLSYFKAIPADEIKIDQSFVKEMCDSPADEKIVDLIIDISHKFDLKVVAEGIETEATLRKLQGMGCDVGQGFYLARPMGFAQYQQWLENYNGLPLFDG